MSEVKVNKISPRTGTDVELNSSAKITNFTSTGIDDNATSTAVTIESSGNVLVGKTSSGVANVGAEFRNGSSNYALLGTASSEAPLILNRTTSDGDIIKIRKDNSAVGSIVAESGDLIVGNGDTALRYNDALNAIYPANANSGASLDNTLNLGWSSVKWANLYMGGNIYLGGTGSANALDDYEEGTFTPALSAGACTFSYSQQQGYYTKVGRMVHYVIYLRGTGTGTTTNTVQITGLPFTSLNATLYEAPAATWNNVSVGDARPIVNTNNTNFSIYYAGTVSQAVVNDTQNKYLLLQGSYETN